MKKIILYGDQYSHFTKQVRNWLKSHNFDFEEKDVSTPKVLEELFKVSEQYAIPAVVVGKKIILGYNESELNKILDAKK